MRGADSGRLPLSPITTSELLLSNLPLLKKILCFFDSFEAFGVQLMLDEFQNFFLIFRLFKIFMERSYDTGLYQVSSFWG